MTAEEIAELRAKLRDVTPLPWRTDQPGSEYVISADRDQDVCDAMPEDAAAIAAVMNAAPRLLDTIEQYQAQRSEDALRETERLLNYEVREIRTAERYDDILAVLRERMGAK